MTEYGMILQTMGMNIILSLDTKKKQQLQKSLEQKKRTLTLWTEKIEMLRVDLDLIRHEYDVRIGYLLLKDNQLDLELIQLQNLKRLMEEGMTYDEAVKYEEDKFYNEILRMQEEQKRIDEEKEILQTVESLSDEVKDQLKELWKKLIRRFHPDLVLNRHEKEEREEIMKQINAAYSAGDLEALEHIALRAPRVSIKEATVEDLEKELIEIENAILMAKDEWDGLKGSEWFGWMKKIDKAKRTGEDVFAQLEKNLLDDIAKKITFARSLREEVNPQVVL